MIQELSSIKEQLFDAPVEVKQAFNEVVDYFDLVNFGKQHPKMKFEDFPPGTTGYLYFVYVDRSKKVDGRPKHIYVIFHKVPNWKRDYQFNEYKEEHAKAIEDYGKPYSAGISVVKPKEDLKVRLGMREGDELIMNPKKGEKYGYGLQKHAKSR